MNDRELIKLMTFSTDGDHLCLECKKCGVRMGGDNDGEWPKRFIDRHAGCYLKADPV